MLQEHFYDSVTHDYKATDWGHSNLTATTTGSYSPTESNLNTTSRVNRAASEAAEAAASANRTSRKATKEAAEAAQNAKKAKKPKPNPCKVGKSALNSGSGGGCGGTAGDSGSDNAENGEPKKVEAASPQKVDADQVAPKGGVGPVNKGKAGEKLQEAKALAEGDKIKGRQPTLELPSGKRSRPDLLTESAAGKSRLREAKNGPGAKLSDNQKELQEAIKNGQPVTPRGKRAAAAGLKPGVPTVIDEFLEDRF